MNKISTIILEGTDLDNTVENIEKFCTDNGINPKVFGMLSLSIASVQKRNIVGMEQYVIVIVDNRSSNNLCAYGRTVYIRTFTFTPDNRNCSSIGEILYSKTWSNSVEALQDYKELVELLKKGK